MATTRITRAAAAASLFALTLGVTACGGGEGLTANDQKVCYDAHESDAEAVYKHADDVDSKKLGDLAASIQPGSSDSDDDDTMGKIVKFCEDNGFDADKYAKENG